MARTGPDTALPWRWPAPSGFSVFCVLPEVSQFAGGDLEGCVDRRHVRPGAWSCP